MKAILTIVNNESTNKIVFNNITNTNYFIGEDNGNNYTVDLKDHYYFDMISCNHTTKVRIEKEKDSNIEVIDDNGSVLLPIDVLAINENNGMISLVYKIDNIKNSISIEFIREV